MKKILFLLCIFAIIMLNCTEIPVETETVREIIIEQNTETLIKDGTIEFCDYELLDTWIWDENYDTWNDLDLSEYTEGQAIVEISLIFVDSLDPSIDAASITIRKNENSQEYGIHSNEIIGSKVIITDENGCIEWKHDNNLDVSRKINIKIKLTLIQK